jgi:hypothetical protein
MSLEGDLLRAGGRLRTLQGMALSQVLARPDLPAGRCRVHRIPRSTSVTIAQTPLLRDGTAGMHCCFVPAAKRKIFVKGLDRVNQVELLR